MTKTTFIEILRQRLSTLPKDELENVIHYHEEYFDDAGEDRANKELGDPYTVANKILTERQSPISSESPTSTSSVKWPKLFGITWDWQNILILIGAVTLGWVVFGLFIGFLGTIFGIEVGFLFGGLGLIIRAILAFSVSSSSGLVFLGLGLLAVGVGVILLSPFLELVKYIWINTISYGKKAIAYIKGRK